MTNCCWSGFSILVANGLSKSRNETSIDYFVSAHSCPSDMTVNSLTAYRSSENLLKVLN